MTYIVYHTQNGDANIMQYLHQSIEEKHFMMKEESQQGRYVNIIEAEVCIDHVHMLIEIPPKYSISGFMGFLKGKSSQIIFERWANVRYKYRHREFWCRGYYVDTVGKNTKKIREYISNQLKEDQEGEQLTLDKKIREYISNQLKEDQEGEQLTLDFEDPFKGK